MKQLLKYYYNIDVDNILKKEEYYYFYYNSNLFLLITNYRSEQELKEIYLITQELIKKNINVSEIIINNQETIVSEFEEKEYILTKINTNTSLDYSIEEIVKLQNVLKVNTSKTNLYRNNWEILWEEKNDYFEYQIKELGINKKIVLNSFSYYIGLSENAISLVNTTNLNYRENKTIVLSHKRIKFPNMEIDFLNPLNFIFDINVRDIGEYLKSLFFSTNINKTLKELKKYLSIVKLTDYEANMLYARILYPSYYFDIYENVIEDKMDEEELLSIINRVDEYEQFLKIVYFELNKKNKIEKINWLIEKRVIK